MCGIYFLTDLKRKRSYIGYSNDIKKRFRTHRLKLKASAKYTKTFDGHILWAAIVGLPTKRKAMSLEWFAKRRRLKVHDKACVIENTPHKRLFKFFAPLKHIKFKHLCPTLTIYVNDPTHQWSENLKWFYNLKDIQQTNYLT